MDDEGVPLSHRFGHGCIGAFLAGLTGISVQWFWHDVNWWVVGACLVFGFILAWILGEQAIDFLKTLWWWT